MRRVVVLLTVPALVLVGLLLPAACATKNSPSAAGQECFAASDCEPGLVCVPQRGGGRICSNDLTQVTGRPPAEAGMADAGDAATDAPAADAPVEDTGTDTGIADAGDAG